MMYSCICTGVIAKVLFGERPLRLFPEPDRRRI
jgi:hypothetical protein